MRTVYTLLLAIVITGLCQGCGLKRPLQKPERTTPVTQTKPLAQNEALATR